MNEFDRGIRELRAEIKKVVVETVKKTALRVNQTIILATPVDTGRARANWIATVGFGNAIKVDDVDPTGGATISKNTQTIITAKEELEMEIHLTNNLDYIIPLNNGHSGQAPAGFIEKAVQVAESV